MPASAIAIRKMFPSDAFKAEEWLSASGPTGAAEPLPEYGQRERPRNAVVEETFKLASLVMDYCERLQKVNRVFADQILRSGTSVGSHTREAQGAESLADFIHKMKIAHKELEETDYRLRLCQFKPHDPQAPELVRATQALFPLFHSILRTSIERLRSERSERLQKRTTSAS